MSRSRESERTTTCPSCLKPSAETESFCAECGAPLGDFTNLDPLQTIHTQGFLFRKALEGRPKPIVLAGVWILHLPLLVASIAIALYILLNLRRRSEYIFFFALAGLAYYAFVVLYRITRNYIMAESEKPELSDEYEDE